MSAPTNDELMKAKAEYEKQYAAWRDSAPGERVGALLLLVEMEKSLRQLVRLARKAELPHITLEQRAKETDRLKRELGRLA